MRLYEDGKPAQTPDHLTWSAAPPKDGEPVFVAGNPGSTQRLLTADQLETPARLSICPKLCCCFRNCAAGCIRFTEESAEHARIANDLLFGIENSYKAYHGEEKALVDPALIAAKRKADADLKAQVAKDAKLAGRDRRSLGRHRQGADRSEGALSIRYGMMEARAGIGSDLFRLPAHWCARRRKRPSPMASACRNIPTAAWRCCRKTMLDPAAGLSGAGAGGAGILAVQAARKSDRRRRTAPRSSWAKIRPKRLSARLANPGWAIRPMRKALWDGGMAAIQASDDPMIKFVLATDAASRAIRKQL